MTATKRVSVLYTDHKNLKVKLSFDGQKRRNNRQQGGPHLTTSQLQLVEFWAALSQAIFHQDEKINEQPETRLSYTGA
jgi:hypothetical protein